MEAGPLAKEDPLRKSEPDHGRGRWTRDVTRCGLRLPAAAAYFSKTLTP